MDVVFCCVLTRCVEKRSCLGKRTALWICFTEFSDNELDCSTENIFPLKAKLLSILETPKRKELLVRLRLRGMGGWQGN